MKALTACVCVVCMAAACVMLAGCGPKLDDLEARVSALEEKGVPDSLLSQPKVFLYQVKAARKSANSGLARKNVDSLLIYLEKAEAWYEAGQQALKPEVDKLLASIGEKRKQLSGLQLAVADSLGKIIDSFVAKDWLLQARDKALLLESMLPQLLADEESAKKLRPKVIGTWAGERVPTAEGFKAKALEKKQFEFSADGKLHAVESMKGQTDEFLKEDWQFESWGTWDIKGDTVLLKITRELCQKQVFENFREVDGKKKWVREEKPTYDTTITDGSKDRYMTWDYFEQWLKKRK